VVEVWRAAYLEAPCEGLLIKLASPLDVAREYLEVHDVICHADSPF
jgi:hypothetical protein